MRLRNISCPLTLAPVMALGGKAWCADQSKVTVLIDNDKVKVLRITGPAGNHQQTDSDDHLVIPLKDFKSKETRNGKTEVLERDVGKAYWRKGGPRLRLCDRRGDDHYRPETGQGNHAEVKAVGNALTCHSMAV